MTTKSILKSDPTAMTHSMGDAAPQEKVVGWEDPSVCLFVCQCVCSRVGRQRPALATNPSQPMGRLLSRRVPQQLEFCQRQRPAFGILNYAARSGLDKIVPWAQFR